MNGYLLDTNAASVLWDARHLDHDRIKAFLANISPSPIWISIIVLAEIEYGLKIAPKMHVSLQNDVRNEMAKFFEILDLDKHTVAPYSDLRAELFKKYSPRNQKGRLTAKRPENLFDRTSAKELGVQENDIWLVSQAIQYNLILVTDDRMSRLGEVSNSLSEPLQIAKWK
jgi:predicted nucleic acid-binding protein